MATGHSGDDLLDFLAHAGERGLMPAATARALAVASRQVLSILSDEERADVRRLDTAAAAKRFANKRAKDFNPTSLREYGRRFQRAIDLFSQWLENPAEFSVPTRTTAPARKTARAVAARTGSEGHAAVENHNVAVAPPPASGGYQSAVPIRPGVVVTILNIPADLSKVEADRLAQFVRMLAID
jgi:hypothetical protein